MVQPATAILLLSQTQQFQAIVSGTSNTGVQWSVNGIAGGNMTLGTVTSGGMYEAPAILLAGITLTVSAVSLADSTAKGSASVTLTDNISVNVSPQSVSVAAGAAQIFTAKMTDSGDPAPGLTWTVNGVAAGSSVVGTIVATGNSTAIYTAPAVPPSPANVTVAATSVADATKSGEASVTITCGNMISPLSASVQLGQTQAFSAALCLSSGTAIVWDVNGIVGGNSSVGTIVAASSGGSEITALYTAPVDMPSVGTVTIHATAGLESASATVSITSGVSVSVSPNSVAVNVSQRATFTAQVTSSSDQAVEWTVNGILNGNPAVGEICLPASNPCVSPNGATPGGVDYIAPATVPSANPVTLTATSRADHSRSGNATVFVAAQTGPVSVVVAPLYAFVAPSGTSASTTRFFARVMGTAESGVAWSVQSGVGAQGCGGAACGSIDANGLYTAPSVAPSPNAIAVKATSLADPSKSATATLVITSGPAIQVLLPSSVMAGAVESFPFEVEGVNFVAGSGSSASTILFNGAPRNTTCASTRACTTALNPADLQSAATITVQIQNPGSPGSLSNPVPFVIVPFDVSEDTITLSESQSAATGEDIVVVEPTTAAASAPINVDFIGFFTGDNTCGIQGSPLAIARPPSGSETVSLCVHGNGLDPTFTYTFIGPGQSDIAVTASSIAGIFPNMIELDLMVSSTTVPGVRSLFITTVNNDRAVATGMLEVR